VDAPEPDGGRLREHCQVLGRAARLLASASCFDDTLRQTLAACLPALGDFGFFDAVVAPGEVRRTAAAFQAPDIEALLAPTRWVEQHHPRLNLCALSTGEPALHPDIDDAWYRQVAASGEHLELLRRLAFRSMITVPLRYQDQLLGALTLFMGRSGRRHGPEQLQLAGELALLAAPVVANARLVEQHQSIEAALRQNGERLRTAMEAESRARADEESARHRFELLSAAGALLARSLDLQDTLRAVASTIVPGIADWCRIDLLDEQGMPQRVLAHHVDPGRAQHALDMVRTLRASARSVGSMSWCIAQSRPYYGHYDQPPASQDPAMRRFARVFGMRVYYNVPLVARGRTIGAMGVVQAESGRELSAADRALVHELAQRAALAIDNARAYAEAEAARRQAETASRAKDEFLAMLGHELRNPLAPIASALELMARRDSQALVDERLIIARQVTHLSRLIDDLLDVSRITQGKVELQRAVLDLRVVVGQAIEQTQPLFEKRVHPVQVRLPDTPVYVDGDVTRLTQVLCNLLINAAKFTPPEGLVTVSLEQRDGWAELSVEDTGRGIAPGLLPDVFDLFVQGRQALDRQSGGLGLGLAIVRRLVELHGGQVAAHSAGEGQGSRFTVRLPAVAGDIPAAPAPRTESKEEPEMSGRILIVDDNTDAAETLADLLRLVGYEVRCAGEAEAAMKTLDEYVPQIALLDIGLPGQDGYALAQRMRADPRAVQTKLVALTGYGRDSDRSKALGAQFDEHLVKPVSADHLIAVVQQMIGA